MNPFLRDPPIEKPNPQPSAAASERFEEILNYWIGADSAQQLWNPKSYFKSRIPLWFDGAASTDQAIRKQFEADVELAARGSLEHWRGAPRSSLALIILLDQFSTNLHRGTARGYLQSAMALAIAQEAIERGFDQSVGFAERIFFYLPFQHSESLALQERSVALLNRLLQSVPPQLKEIFEVFLDSANRDHDVIRQFGRFPDRNAIFGRVSTPLETRYLDQGGPHF